MKIKVIVFLVVLATVLFSCTNPAQSFFQKDTPTGTLYINLPEPVSESRGITTEYASLNTTYYEAYIYNSEHSATAVLEDTPISVPVGTFTVVIIAGKGSGSEKFMLGSGSSTDVIVVQDQRTDITITLHPLEINLSTPESVVAGRDFSFSYSGNLNNQFLQVTPNSGSRAYYTDVSGDLQEVHYFTTGTITGPEFSFSETLQAPSTPMDLKISISVVYVFLDSTNTYWKLPAYYGLPLENVSDNTIGIIEDPTGIGLTLVWDGGI